MTEFEELLESLLVERYRPRLGRAVPTTREELVDQLKKERPRKHERTRGQPRTSKTARKGTAREDR